jgi:hypothetical protein
LKVRSEKLETAEQQIERLRDRVDELGTVKQQLREETAAHADHYAQLLSVEQELDGLRKIRVTVEEYRLALTESNIKLEEVTLKLQENQMLVSVLKSQGADAGGAHFEQLQEMQHLQHALAIALERVRELEVDGGVGVGCGSTEMNPLLMQELAKLRSENADLRNKLSASSMEALETLEKQVADTTSTNSSLQRKWMTCKDQLADAQATITAQKRTIQSCNEKFAVLQNEYSECCRMFQEDAKAELDRKLSVIAEIRGRLFDTKQCLEVSEAEAEALSGTNSQLQVSLDAALCSYRLEQESVKSLIEKGIADRETLQHKHQVEMESMRAGHADEIMRCNETLAKFQDTANAKIQSLTLDCEEERSKRRRVEREKKFHEAEAHRHKMQSSNGVGCGSGLVMVSEDQQAEWDAALREFKRVEAQLVETKAELANIKAASVGCNGASKNGSLMSDSNKGSLRSSATRLGNTAIGTTASAEPSSSSGTVSAEAIELSECRIAQLVQEKRELLARSLEEGRERMEANQKLIQCEREVAALKSKVTRITLEKERLERRLEKQGVGQAVLEAENLSSVRTL